MQELIEYYKAILHEVTGAEIVAKHGPKEGAEFLKRYIGRIEGAMTGDPQRQKHMLRQLGMITPGSSKLGDTSQVRTVPARIDVSDIKSQKMARMDAGNRPSGMRSSPLAVAGRQMRGFETGRIDLNI